MDQTNLYRAYTLCTTIGSWNNSETNYFMLVDDLGIFPFVCGSLKCIMIILLGFAVDYDRYF